jgi:hypothetical protein
MDRNGLIFVIACVLFGLTSIVRCVLVKRKQARAAMRDSDDPEAAALVEDCDVAIPDEAPPQYSDVVVVSEQKTDNKQ